MVEFLIELFVTPDISRTADPWMNSQFLFKWCRHWHKLKSGTSQIKTCRQTYLCFSVYKHKQINVLPLCAVAVLKELKGTRSVHLGVELAPISGGGGGCSIRWRGHRYDRGGRDENKNENYRYLKAMVKMVQHCLCHLAHFFFTPTLQFQRGLNLCSSLNILL